MAVDVAADLAAAELVGGDAATEVAELALDVGVFGGFPEDGGVGLFGHGEFLLDRFRGWGSVGEAVGAGEDFDGVEDGFAGG